MSEKRRLIRVTGLLSGFTLISRLTGLIRDALIGALLGTGMLADVFWITFELPNIARRVLGEGALSAFVIPLFAARRKESEASGWSFVNRSFNAIGALAIVLTILGIAFSGLIFNLFGGFGVAASAKERASSALYQEKVINAPPPDERAEDILNQADRVIDHGVFLTRLMFPHLLILALTSLLMGICNAMDSFAAPALRSVINNLTMIAAGGAAMGLAINPTSATTWLAVSFVGGSVIGLWSLFPLLRRRGWRWSLEWAPKDPHVRELFSMMGAGLFSTAIYQINIALAGALAAYSGPGNKAFLVMSQRLIQFPMALTATAMSTAMLPRLAQFILDGEDDKLRETMGFSKRVEMILMVPAAVGLMIFGAPIIELVFQRGRWTSESTLGTFGALLFYAPGLIPQGWIRLLQPLYYARRDVKTPVRAAFVSVIVNIVLAVVFTFFTDWAAKGLALASTLAAFANYYYLAWGLRRDPARPLAGARSATTFSRSALSALISIGGTRWIYDQVNPVVRGWIASYTPIHSDSTMARAITLLPFLALAGALYFVVARIVRTPEADRAMDMILRKLKRRSRGNHG